MTHGRKSSCLILDISFLPLSAPASFPCPAFVLLHVLLHVLVPALVLVLPSLTSTPELVDQAKQLEVYSLYSTAVEVCQLTQVEMSSLKFFQIAIVNRPGVAGAVLQTTSSFIY